jgi:hypothetical protein
VSFIVLSRDLPIQKYRFICLWENGDLVKIRYYIDAQTEQPHIYNHNINEKEAEYILLNAGEDRPGVEGSRMAIGQTKSGRYVRIIYVLDSEHNEIFVITGYELTGKPLFAYRRRLRRKGKK